MDIYLYRLFFSSNLSNSKTTYVFRFFLRNSFVKKFKSVSFVKDSSISVTFYISEQEADAEEERLRKERERQQKQDVMTLGETREQISNLDNELSQLKAEKHQLFLQLKKVLNEDDRRRQLIKETRFASQLQFLKEYSRIIMYIVHNIFIEILVSQCLFRSFDDSRRISGNRPESSTSAIVFAITT